MSQIEKEKAETVLAEPATSRPDDLPSPHQLPNADVVIFDGRCLFCTRQVKNLKRFDGKNRLAYTSLHDEFVRQNFSDLSHDQMMSQMYVVPNGDNGYTNDRHGGAAAIRYLTRRLPRLWIFAPLMHIPFSMPLWQWGYNIVAKHRYKIAGKSQDNCSPDGTCELHFNDDK